jgi:hypothetical protein
MAANGEESSIMVGCVGSEDEDALYRLEASRKSFGFGWR